MRVKILGRDLFQTSSWLPIFVIFEEITHTSYQFFLCAIIIASSWFPFIWFLQFTVSFIFVLVENSPLCVPTFLSPIFLILNLLNPTHSSPPFEFWIFYSIEFCLKILFLFLVLHLKKCVFSGNPDLYLLIFNLL